MEITWYGQTCVRLRGRDAVVVADAYQSIVGPTGRGITADIATYSHPDDAPLAKAKGKRTRDGKTVVPSSLEPAFSLDGPGEYEVKDVLLTGVRTDRDDEKGQGGPPLPVLHADDAVEQRGHGEGRSGLEGVAGPGVELGLARHADVDEVHHRPAGEVPGVLREPVEPVLGSGQAQLDVIRRGHLG